MTEIREDRVDDFIIDCLLDDLDTVEFAMQRAYDERDYRDLKKVSKALRRVLKYYGCFAEDGAPTPGCDPFFEF
jgi:hypothetical protein